MGKSTSREREGAWHCNCNKSNFKMAAPEKLPLENRGLWTYNTKALFSAMQQTWAKFKERFSRFLQIATYEI